ncbi:MAG: hypothetical protein ACKO85_02225, partial [Isosphaeraceae bacterium]
FFSLFKIAVITFLEFILLCCGCFILVLIMNPIFGPILGGSLFPGFLILFCGFSAIGDALRRVAELLARNPIEKTTQTTDLR